MTARHSPASSGLDTWLGDPIEDASEETFLLFSENFPSHNLGFVDSKSEEIELEISGRSLILRQSPGLLNSQRQGGTTGAVLWKITPLVGEWLASLPKVLQDENILDGESTVVELGCGITGLIGIMLAPKISTYILTDQGYVMRALRENIDANNLPRGRQPKNAQAKSLRESNLKAVALDWETDTPSSEGLGLRQNQSIDLVVVCDCVYNEYLISPLVQTLADICRLGSPKKPTAVLVAQQLRSETIFEQFLSALLEQFKVCRLQDQALPPSLQGGSGYVMHLALSKEPVSI